MHCKTLFRISWIIIGLISNVVLAQPPSNKPGPAVQVAPPLVETLPQPSAYSEGSMINYLRTKATSGAPAVASMSPRLTPSHETALPCASARTVCCGNFASAAASKECDWPSSPVTRTEVFAGKLGFSSAIATLQRMAVETTNSARKRDFMIAFYLFMTDVRNEPTRINDRAEVRNPPRR